MAPQVGVLSTEKVLNPLGLTAIYSRAQLAINASTARENPKPYT